MSSDYYRPNYERGSKRFALGQEALDRQHSAVRLFVLRAKFVELHSPRFREA